MITLLNAMNIKKDRIIGHHLVREGEGSHMSNKYIREIHIIIITYFKQQLQFFKNNKTGGGGGYRDRGGILKRMG